MDKKMKNNDLSKNRLITLILGLVAWCNIGLCAMSEQEWQEKYQSCNGGYAIDCRLLIHNGNLPSVEECDFTSCAYVGNIHKNALGTTKAFEYFTKCFNLGNFECAIELGFLHFESNDFSKAKKYFDMACEKANYDFDKSMGCDFLGTMFLEGIGGVKDYNLARKYLEKSCNLKSGVSCISLAVLYRNGTGVVRDYHKANEYAKKSCDLYNGLGCYLLGLHYFLGFGIRQDYKMGVEYFGKACDLGYEEGCEMYAQYRNRW